MNKLCKYLPFGIKLKPLKSLRKSGEKRLEPEYVILNGIIGNKVSALERHSSLMLNINNIKPILRPFENLTKELPLTKAAAEIIGIEEGSLIIPIVEYFKLVLEPCNIRKMNLFEFDDIVKTDRYYKLISLNGYELYLHSDWYLDISAGNNIIDELPFDFLRAMHFAVNFEKEEYIKLED